MNPVTYTAWAGLAMVARQKDPSTGAWVLDASVFHTANLVLHAVAALLVYWIVRALLKARAVADANPRVLHWAASAGAVLFAIHPLQVEAVAWVSGFRDVLGGALALAATAAYVHFVASRKRWAYVVGLVLFVSSMLSKPSAMSLPAALAAIDCLVYRRRMRDVMVSLLPWLVAAAGAAVLAKVVQPSAAIAGAPLWARPIVAADALAVYAGKVLVPWKLGIDYGRSPEWVVAHPGAWWTVVVTLAVGAVLFVRRRRWPLGACAGAVAVGMLLPVLGFVKFEFQRHSTVADRYVYLSMLGAAVALAALVRLRPTRAVATAVGLVLALYGGRAYAQVWTWRDSHTLFAHALEVNPTSLAGHNWLALEAGQQKQYAVALQHFRAALDAHPADPVTNDNMGHLLLNMGAAGEAVPYLRAGLRGRGEAVIYVDLAMALARSGDADGALAACRDGIARWPRDAVLREIEGALLGQRGDWAAAREALAEAVRLNPHLASARAALAEANRHVGPTTR